MKTILKNILPRPYYERFKRYAIYGVSDVIDTLTKKRDELIPPKRLIFIGGAEYRSIGDQYFRIFKKYCTLSPTSSVLDVGCGIGRMARPLTGFLTSGKYEGFDIDKAGIDWCNTNISKRFDNFNFQVADIYNKHYNPKGKFKALEYKFPFRDNSFDFVFLTSVFTHMYPEDIENYLREIHRVLKERGKCLITYFIWNENSSALVSEGKSKVDFTRVSDVFYVMDKSVPEDATCFSEEYLRNLYVQTKLNILDPVQFGSWCGRENFISYQDIIIAEKI